MTEGVVNIPGLEGIPFRAPDAEKYPASSRPSPEFAGRQVSDFQHEASARQQAAEIPAAIRAAAGVGSAFTFGMAPALGAKLYGLPGDVYDYAMASPAAQGGELAGFLGSALLSGGESVAGKAGISGIGAVGRGLLGAAGAEAAVERMFAAKVLPQLSARLGKPLSTVMGKAASAGVGFGLHSAGTQLGHDIVHDVPLGGQMLANAAIAGMKGAALGAAIGGSMSAISQGARAVGKRVGAFGGAAASSPEGALSRAKGITGMTEEQVARGQALYVPEGGAVHGGLKELFEAARKPLTEAGESFRSSPKVRLEIHKKAAEAYQKVVDDGLADIAAKPDGGALVARINSRLNERILQPQLGQITEGAARSEIATVADMVKPMAGAKDFASIMRSADALGDVAGPTGKISHQAARIVHNEIAQALRDSAKTVGKEAVAESVISAQTAGFANRWASEGALKVLSKEAEHIGGVMAGSGFRQMMGVGGFLGLMAAGRPVAAGLFGAKAVSLALRDRAGGALAEASWRASFGAGVQGAANNLKREATSAIGGLLATGSRASKGVAKGLGRSLTAQYTRKGLDQARTHADTIIDGSAQRVAESQLDDRMSPQLQAEYLDTFTRARRLLEHHYPLDRKSALTLRMVAEPKGLSAAEGKFMRIYNAVTNPVEVISRISKGDVTRDEMMAMRYVYPAMHMELVKAVTNHIQVMKGQGKSLSVDRVAKLGIVMDAAVDTILEKDFISAIQSTMAAPAKPGPAPQPKPFDQTSLMTPTDKGIYR